MSWEESIASYMREEDSEKQAIELRIRGEQTQALEILRKLEVEKQLTGIRDEVWKFGDVEVTPGMDSWRGWVEARLRAEWPIYHPPHRVETLGGSVLVRGDMLKHGTLLGVVVQPHGEDWYVGIGSHVSVTGKAFPIFESLYYFAHQHGPTPVCGVFEVTRSELQGFCLSEEASPVQRLKRLLIEDCIMRKGKGSKGSAYVDLTPPYLEQARKYFDVLKAELNEYREEFQEMYGDWVRDFEARYGEL